MRTTFRTKDRPEIAELGRVLKQLRTDAGISNRAMAAKLGRGVAFVWKVESGLQAIDIATLIDFASALDTDASAIVSQVESNCLETES